MVSLVMHLGKLEVSFVLALHLKKLEVSFCICFALGESLSLSSVFVCRYVDFQLRCRFVRTSPRFFFSILLWWRLLLLHRAAGLGSDSLHNSGELRG